MMKQFMGAQGLPDAVDPPVASSAKTPVKADSKAVVAPVVAEPLVAPAQSESESVVVKEEPTADSVDPVEPIATPSPIKSPAIKKDVKKKSRRAD
jgi:hypothetical protein